MSVLQNHFLYCRINFCTAESISVLQNQFLYCRINSCTTESISVLQNRGRIAEGSRKDRGRIPVLQHQILHCRINFGLIVEKHILFSMFCPCCGPQHWVSGAFLYCRINFCTAGINFCTAESIPALPNQFLYCRINSVLQNQFQYYRINSVLQNQILYYRINFCTSESISVLQNNFCTAESIPALQDQFLYCRIAEGSRKGRGRIVEGFLCCSIKSCTAESILGS